MKLVRSVAELRAELRPIRSADRIALVPTMGALHEGHAALFRAARRERTHMVATVFVNPRQFNDPADLAAYPKTEARDEAIAAEAGVDVLFVPDAAEIYRSPDATTVHVEGAALEYEGAYRPSHFDGVATVCLKLFNIVEADVAIFGQKDVQQVAVIRQMVRDLHLDLEIEVVPTVRDRDGLALSSRNTRLSPVERERALAIPCALAEALAAHARGDDPRRAARNALAGLDVDYVEVANFDGLPTLVIAARVGATRLIDNIPLTRPELAGLPMTPRDRSLVS